MAINILFNDRRDMPLARSLNSFGIESTPFCARNRVSRHLGANQALFAPETKKRVSREYARISCVSVKTSGRPSPVSAAKDDTTDENGEDHIHLLDAESSPFVSSE